MQQATSHALIHIPRSSDADAALDDRYQTPFAKFMAALLSKSSPTKISMIGTAVWSDIPYDVIVGHGLWMILEQSSGQSMEQDSEKASKKRNVSLSTESNINELSHVVGHLINMGMMLVYKSHVHAANAFISDVIIPRMEQLRATSHKSPMSVAEQWRVPVAQFFAPLIKRAKEHRQEVLALAHAIIEQNILRTGENDGIRAGIPLVDADWINTLALHAATLSIHVPVRELDHTLQVGALIYKDLRSALPRLHQTALEVSLFSKLKTLMSKLPVGTFKNFSSICAGFVPTQILLACLTSETNDYLDARNYAKAIQILNQSSDEEVTERTVARIISRMKPLSDVELALLTELVQQRIPSTRKLSPKMGLHEQQELFIYVRPEDVINSPELALEYATGRAVTTSEPTGPRSAQRKADLKQRLASSIDWHSIDIEQFQRVLAEESLLPEQLADGIARMEKTVQETAVQKLLQSGYCSRAGIARLIQHRLVIPDQGFVIEFAHLVPSAHVRDAFVRELKGFVSYHVYLLHLALHMKPSDAVEIFECVEFRVEIIKLISEISSSPNTKNQHLADLKTLVGAELWTKLVLSCDIELRKVEYRHRRRPTKKCKTKPLARWQDSWKPEQAHGLYALAATLFVPPLEAKAILLRHSEASIFQWLHEGDPQRTRALTNYMRVRHTYYKSHPR